MGADLDIERIEPLPAEPVIDEAEQNENLAFLSGGGVIQGRRAIPQSHFSVEDREHMLKEHDLSRR